MEISTDPWLTRQEVADRLRTTGKTLANWATKDLGPRYVRLGGHGPARYRLSDVIAWENAQFADSGDAA
ncbi:MAG: DNA-binding protein [Corynebacteriales bacterium]|nr:DNA-binding protein [Mycobacteriales bacterium]